MVLTPIAQKGGVGKTAFAISLSAFLAHNNKKVLLIDIDAQCDASRCVYPAYAALREENTIVAMFTDDVQLEPLQTKIIGLDIIPSHIKLSGGDVILSNLMAREYRLRNAIEGVKNNYDFIIIDPPRSLSWITINALSITDYCIIPTDSSIDGLTGIGLVLDTIAKVKKNYNPDLNVAGVVMAISEGTKLTREAGEILAAKYPTLFFQTRIPRNVKMGESRGQHKDIFSYDPKSASALAMEKLFQTELLPKLNIEL